VTHCAGDLRLTTPRPPAGHISRTALQEAFPAQCAFSEALFCRRRNANSSTESNELANHVNRTAVFTQHYIVVTVKCYGTINGLPTVCLGYRLSYVQNFDGHFLENDHLVHPGYRRIKWVRSSWKQVVRLQRTSRSADDMVTHMGVPW
jgi:hypothetical protein